MNGPELFSQIRNELAHSIARRSQVPTFNPVRVSPWLAMALLQKAIRRGRTDLALQAAATLLIDAPDRLWLRCGGDRLRGHRPCRSRCGGTGYRGSSVLIEKFGSF